LVAKSELIVNKKFCRLAASGKFSAPATPAAPKLPQCVTEIGSFWAVGHLTLRILGTVKNPQTGISGLGARNFRDLLCCVWFSCITLQYTTIHRWPAVFSPTTSNMQYPLTYGGVFSFLHFPTFPYTAGTVRTRQQIFTA